MKNYGTLPEKSDAKRATVARFISHVNNHYLLCRISFAAISLTTIHKRANIVHAVHIVVVIFTACPCEMINGFSYYALNSEGLQYNGLRKAKNNNTTDIDIFCIYSFNAFSHSLFLRWLILILFNINCIDVHIVVKTLDNDADRKRNRYHPHWVCFQEDFRWHGGGHAPKISTQKYFLLAQSWWKAFVCVVGRQKSTWHDHSVSRSNDTVFRTPFSHSLFLKIAISIKS